MKDHMESIWRRVQEKQALEMAALRLCRKRRGILSIKLSVSAACGLLATLLPVAGAAQSIIGHL